MNKDNIVQKWTDLLWAGDIDGLHQSKGIGNLFVILFTIQAT
jgi:hypothetical protein